MRSLGITFALLVAGCGDSSKTRITGGDGGVIDAPITLHDGGDGGGSGSDGGPGGTVNDAGQPLCNGSVCECADGVDNDDDTFADVADPQCTGPFDDDESSYATGIPGDNSDPSVQDCFFDGDSGGGNDGCRWDLRCVDPPNGSHCNNQHLEGCDKCLPLVPNGCDCFGCCDVFVDGVKYTVRIVEGCDPTHIDTCQTCTKVTACENPCTECEVCIGRPNPPASCNPDAGVGQCETGVVACFPPDFTCPPEKVCITGCCRPFLE